MGHQEFTGRDIWHRSSGLCALDDHWLNRLSQTAADAVGASRGSLGIHGICAISGLPGSGKSTLLLRILRAYVEPGTHLHGYLTQRLLCRNGDHPAFQLCSPDQGLRDSFALTQVWTEAAACHDSKSGRDRAFPDFVQAISTALAAEAADPTPDTLLVLDEVGGLELLNDCLFSELKLRLWNRRPALIAWKSRQHLELLAKRHALNQMETDEVLARHGCLEQQLRTHACLFELSPPNKRGLDAAREEACTIR